MKKPTQTMLVVGAHPDDEILGVGGTMAHYAAKGWKVHTLIFTRGEASHPWMQEEFLHSDRVDEVTQATKIVGCDGVTFLGLRDGHLMKDTKDPKVVERVKKTILSLKPSRIFTHMLDDRLFIDHRAVHITVLKAVRDIYASTPEYRPEVWGYNIWTMNIRQRQHPQLVVNITDTFYKKLKALNCFQTQSVALYQLIPFVYAKAITSGVEYGSKYVETFHKLYPQ